MAAVTILSDAHFTAIAYFAIPCDWNLVSQCTETQALADTLKSFNIGAYNEVNMDAEPEPELPCVMRICEAPTPVQVLTLIEQYEINASEYGGYFYQPIAYEVRKIRASAIAQLAGYAEAPLTL